ncbi:hypothetical protein Q8791_21155 [Nocardiopsis sp. CT-R113]|uniref:Uncharacterized protein n=1 Tax=Nocardiopsis codii TaxID=3065942 RepID=A0ABU7KDR6_9ACTN|nr:hypothetical protein [Nocardiopsis sp. CT-R113]MEE2039732.1 hypothetical protein [Nocardiopsis sp. CT-R113]
MAEDTNRSASSTIAGYRYQFDLTILEILSADSSEILTIEGVEDVDKSGFGGSSLVQCKYLSSQKYSLAGLRSSLIPMLDSFERGLRSNYIVHAHFGKETSQVPRSLTVDELKTSLTEHQKKTGNTILHFGKYKNSTLEDFVKFLSIKGGKSMEEQKKEVLTGLTSAMECSREEAVGLHYGNALTFVAEKACQKDVSSRRVTREQLLNHLNRKPLLYTIWHREVTSIENFVKATARRLRATRLLLPKKNRVLYLEEPLTASQDSFLDTAGLITFLALDDYGEGQLYTARPWTVVVRSSSHWYMNLKRDLLGKGVAYYDGYEDVLFNPQLFHRMPVQVRFKRGDAIEKTSYDIRLVNEESFGKYLKEGFEVDTILSTVQAVDMVPNSDATMVHIPGLDAEKIVSLIARV